MKKNQGIIEKTIGVENLVNILKGVLFEIQTLQKENAVLRGQVETVNKLVYLVKGKAGVAEDVLIPISPYANSVQYSSQIEYIIESIKK